MRRAALAARVRRDPAMKRPATALLIGLALLAGCVALQQATPPPAPVLAPEQMPPPEPREFRAAWVATVANIDWPSRPGLPADVQRAEALAMLEKAREIGLNALILQVRPAGDALYVSALEPWSEYLSGEQGKAPSPAYDPLAFWVTEAHRRGIELHAWFNPYRARQQSAKTPLVAPHIGVRVPQLVKRYGDQLWMDPGEPEAAAHTLAVMRDVVQRYDIDAVHIDDYFYPYPISENGAEVPFPDDPAWARYQLGGGTLSRDDWRRAQVDALVEAIPREVQRIKPWVRVGISPFGIGRPDRRPAGITGFSQYDKLYADVEKWFERGWLDYLAPQLYWPITRQGQEFAPLLDYWLAENKRGRHLWPGLYTSRIAKDAPAPAEAPASGSGPWPASELIAQIGLQRARPAAAGHIHFSMIALQQDRDGIAAKLKAGPYAQAALVPATPWLDNQPPPAPTLAVAGRRVQLKPAAGEPAWLWAVWRREAGRWRFVVLPGRELSVDAEGADAVVVSAVDRLGNTSARAAILVP
jgi:uncharacterized lipoprotein YddW (UPF0748 family)